MAKSYKLGAPAQVSERRADPSYVKAQTNGTLPQILVVPGFQQNRGMLMGDPIPLPPMQKVAPPWRFR